MQRCLLVATLGLGISAGCAAAEPPQVLASAWQRLQILASTGSDDLFASGYIWHDPGTYTPSKRATLNSEGWGGGWGRQLNRADGEDMIYAMAFLDSHRNLEPVLGYARQWRWSPLAGGPSLGWGYTAGVTSRADIANNLPLPIVLPLASLSWGRVSVFATFIPRLNGLPNNGNVGFVFARYRLSD